MMVIIKPPNTPNKKTQIHHQKINNKSNNLPPNKTWFSAPNARRDYLKGKINDEIKEKEIFFLLINLMLLQPTHFIK